MNTFKIYFKENTILEVGGTKKTFKANTMYGFKFISDKELKNIRKQLIGKPNINFYLTDNLLGCYQIIYGNKKPKDISTTNLVTLNKGKKNKNGTKYATKQSIQEKVETVLEPQIGEINKESINEEIVPPVEEEVTIVTDNEMGKEDNNGNE